MDNRLSQLRYNRNEYIQIKWKSSSGVSTRLVDVDDRYLLNIMRSVSKSLVLAEHFPEVQEFQEYNGVRYKDYQKYLANEYSYRQELVEDRYREFLDRQMYEQLERDRDYYDDRYDIGALGDIY